MEFCTACGARIDKSHNYCGQCGAPLGTVNNNETDVQETTSGSSSKETGEGQQKGTDWAWSPEATPKFKKTMWETYKPRLKVAGYVLLALFYSGLLGRSLITQLHLSHLTGKLAIQGRQSARLALQL